MSLNGGHGSKFLSVRGMYNHIHSEDPYMVSLARTTCLLERWDSTLRTMNEIDLWSQVPVRGGE